MITVGGPRRKAEEGDPDCDPLRRSPLRKSSLLREDVAAPYAALLRGGTCMFFFPLFDLACGCPGYPYLREVILGPWWEGSLRRSLFGNPDCGIPPQSTRRTTNQPDQPTQHTSPPEARRYKACGSCVAQTIAHQIPDTEAGWGQSCMLGKTMVKMVSSALSQH